jgi:hypothetical protein
MPESYFEDATITIDATLTTKKFVGTKPYTGPVKLSFFKGTEAKPFFTSVVNAVDGKIDKPFKHKLPKVENTEEYYDLRVSAEYKKVNKALLAATIWPKETKVQFVGKDGKGLPNWRFIVKQQGINDQALVTDGEGKCTVTLMARKAYTVKTAGSFQVLEDKQATAGQYRDHVIKVDPTIVAKFISPIVTEAPYKADADNAPAMMQFVNLKSGTAEHNEGAGCDAKGNILAITVSADPEENGRKDDKIYFEISFGRESKRSNPAPALLGDFAVYERKTVGKKITGYVKLDADGGKATFEVNLGLAGGDTCEVKIGGTDAVSDAKFKLINWRKIYGQVTRVASLPTPDLTPAKDCFKKTFIDFEVDSADEVLVADDKVPAGSIVDGAIIESGAPSEALIVGDHNVTAFKALLDTKFGSEDRPVAHLIFCHFQLDADNTPATGKKFIKGKKTGQTQDTIAFPGGGTVPGIKVEGTFADASGLFFPIDLKDGSNAVKSCRWEEVGGTGAGDIPSTDYKIDHPAHGNNFYVRLPAAAKSLSDAGKKIRVRFKIAYAKGWYNGWCTGAGRHLVIKAGRPAKDICGTIVHEIGHAISQSPKEPGTFPGLPAPPHERYYTNNRGHSGPHCADGLNATDYDTATFRMDTVKAQNECTCIMFGAGADLRNNTMAFCAKCTPYVKAVAISTVST